MSCGTCTCESSSCCSSKGVWPKYDKPFYFHFLREDEYNHITNGVTVCAIPMGVGKNEFYIGSSMSNTIDNYSKKIGRKISENRALISETVNGKSVKANNFEELKAEALKVAKKHIHEVLNDQLKKAQRTERIAKSRVTNISNSIQAMSI